MDELLDFDPVPLDIEELPAEVAPAAPSRVIPFPVRATQFGNAPAAMELMPAPQVRPSGGVPAYGLGVTAGSGGGEGITVRDMKAAGVGALLVIALQGLVRFFSRS